MPTEVFQVNSSADVNNIKFVYYNGQPPLNPNALLISNPTEPIYKPRGRGIFPRETTAFHTQPTPENNSVQQNAALKHLIGQLPETTMQELSEQGTVNSMRRPSERIKATEGTVKEIQRVLDQAAITRYLREYIMNFIDVMIRSGILAETSEDTLYAQLSFLELSNPLSGGIFDKKRVGNIENAALKQYEQEVADQVLVLSILLPPEEVQVANSEEWDTIAAWKNQLQERYPHPLENNFQ